MKAKVNRILRTGVYYVSFAFSDFTPQEVAKMQSFGIPTIQLRRGGPAGASVGSWPLTQINNDIVAGFSEEDAARAYETTVLGQAKSAMEALRQRKDEFSSTAEVDI